MKKVSVNLGRDSYEIKIGAGILNEAGEYLSALGFSDRAVVIADETAANLYGDTIGQSLAGSGFDTAIVTFPPGEASKTLDTAAELYTRLCEAKVERMTPMLALGGGVTGDVAGFVAATYLRGLPLIQLPTTLLAQVDSSIGGKVAVDYQRLKNIIGAFYQPRLVLADLSVIRTLSTRQVSDGLAEVIKYGTIKDASFFEYLDKNIDTIRNFNIDAMEEVVSRSAQIKAGLVEVDERDFNERRVLNFGHTVGHAIESVSKFTTGHGEAVALGMLAAGRISIKMGLFSQRQLETLEQLLLKAGLPVKMPRADISAMMKALGHDKKSVGGKINFVLLRSLGDAFVSNDVGHETIEEVLREMYEAS
jgi:3-dehydroquinate synthase